MVIGRTWGLVAAAWILAATASAGTAHGWTAKTQVSMAEWARAVAPPDLRNQMERHKREFQRGVLDLAQDPEARALVADPNAQAELTAAIDEHVGAAIKAIEVHRPFAEIVRRMGNVAALVALAGFPPVSLERDKQESRYAADFARYVESAYPRMRVIFYSTERNITTPQEFDQMVAGAFERGRISYPMVAREYRRIGVADGRKHFDDRSTAFAVGALSYSHSVSDIAGALRYIWLRAGGADNRSIFTLDKDQMVLLSGGAQGR